MVKKFYKQKRQFFYIITKNLNWEILTKNLVTFKEWYRVKHNFFLGEFHEKPIYMGKILKEGGLESLQI